MNRIRVLVVDDSAVVRKFVAEAVTASPDLVLAGVAADGRAALERLEATAPDVVTLDVEMPVLDGIGTLRELRRSRPRLPVLMLSSHTERGALATLDALAAGASDFVAKPATGGPDATRAFLQQEVVPRLRALARRASPAAPRPSPPPVARRTAASAIRLVVIGVSTGGPQALERVLPKLPRHLSVPVAIVQHMPPMFTRLLAERLSTLGPLPVREAVRGAPLRPGEVWIAPGGRHLTLAEGTDAPLLELDDGPPENSCRPAADVLFRAAAEHYGAGVLAVVLTGMGRDGLAGCERIRSAGGSVLAQDEATSVVWGMPGVVVGAGLADAVVPIADVGREIATRVERGRLQVKAVGALR